MKFKNVKNLLFGFILMFVSCFVNTTVYAKTMTPDEIQGPAYVIGSHVFTREVNETTGYEGKLTTNLIMLASQTIESSDLDDMIIYYKTASGMWINGLTGATIEAPASFEINYTNLQLENTTISAPKAPIVYLDGPLTIDDETGTLSYQLNIFIDDIMDTNSKVDGVEMEKVVNGTIQQEELKYGQDFKTITTFSDDTGIDGLIVGRKYHFDWRTIEIEYGSYTDIYLKAYNLDENGNKIYSETISISNESFDKNLKNINIVNDYSNPDYILKTEGYYIYRLGIKKPDAYVFKVNSKKFGYMLHYRTKSGGLGQLGHYSLDEKSEIVVPENTISEYYATLGYYDVDGTFHGLGDWPSSDSNWFVIDTRTLTAPTLYYNVARDYVGPGSTPESIAEGEYIYINDEFYEEQEEDTLDYQIEGAEIYRVYYEAGTTSNPGYKPVYELIADNPGYAHVFPPSGSGFYTARVYATNEEGKRIYSDFSDRIGVVRTPLISASEVKDGKVTVTIENIDEYWKDSGITFTLYTIAASKNKEEKLASIIYQGDQEAVFEIEVTENMKIYADASIHDWVHSTDEEDVYAYSYTSNGIDIVVE